ncbi:alpha-amylase [Mytilinidion resinicola]|uniref:alpha-amylase n=1 Tax=Mytilinidion resinicola TaxID=574789 RepID=A0A6A6Z946_9PEZI|nr:alpha-amylase [Mytilinidion resinicola]KAF2817253.1 alpha-amylase [Mytilinidion resinicola]
MKLCRLLSLAFFLSVGLAATAADWRGKAIYQVFTDRFSLTNAYSADACDVTKNEYCGGTWKGIQSRLDYIQGMGFTAIWISPVTLQVPGGYHGYYQTDLYRLNDHFGTADDLKSLASDLKSRGMYLMVDVVPNHMGWPGCPDTVDYSQLHPFSDASCYHSYCPLLNYDNQTETEVCWLGDCNTEMPDLKTEDSTVATGMQDWIKSLVSNYSIDGLRMDSAKSVNKGFFPGFCAAAGVFCMGEVADGRATYAYAYQDYMDSILDYPLYFAINRTFQQQSDMSDLTYNLELSKNGGSTGSKDNTLLGTFIENHDNPRFPWSTDDMSLVKNAIAFTILSDGIPIIYQGQEQHLAGADDPGCREAIWPTGYNTSTPLYGHIAYLNQMRNFAQSQSSSYLTYKNWVTNYTTDTIMMRNDIVRTILTNQGESGGSYSLTTEGMGFESGETVVEVFTCDKSTANSDGEVNIRMNGGLPRVLFPESSLTGFGMCGY